MNTVLAKIYSGSPHLLQNIIAIMPNTSFGIDCIVIDMGLSTLMADRR